MIITYLNDAWNAQPSGTLFNRSVVAAYSHVADMLRTLASCIWPHMYILSVYIQTYRRCICVCYTCTHTYIYIYKYMKSNHIYLSFYIIYIIIYIYIYRHVFPWIPSWSLKKRPKQAFSSATSPLLVMACTSGTFQPLFPGETMETPWKNGPFIWVNYNMSLTWNVGLFWNSLPH